MKMVKLMCRWLERWVQQLVERPWFFNILSCWYQILLLRVATAIGVDGSCSSIMSVFSATGAIKLGVGTRKS